MANSIKLVASKGKPGDPRMGSLIVPLAERPQEKIAVGLVWFPSDEGTVLNAGRQGSRHTPAKIAEMLPKAGSAINLEEGVDLSKHICLVDGGAAEGTDLPGLQASLEGLTSTAFKNNLMPIVVGGSNDQSYCNASAWLKHNPAAAEGTVINIDAHFDVRPPNEDGKLHSGTPFYSLLNDGRFKGKLVEFAAQGHQCSKAHADYITDRDGTVLWLGHLRQSPKGPVGEFQGVLDSCPGPIFVSFDVDSIRGADMPGVSCPSPIGLTAEEAISIARAAGRCDRVELLDMSELNVGVEGDRSPRLGVAIIYNFLLGLAERAAAGASAKRRKTDPSPSDHQ